MVVKTKGVPRYKTGTPFVFSIYPEIIYIPASS